MDESPHQSSQPPSAPSAPGTPRIVGIVNLTEDSFSDGGRFLDPEAALAHALQLRADGADVIDLGAASSHPDSAQVSAEEERRRLEPVLERLVAEGIPVSVDSFLPETHRFAIERGAAYLNDIQGFPDPETYPLLAASECDLIVMHSVQRRGAATRVLTDPAEIWAGIQAFFDERVAALEAAGVGRGRLVLDPGLGYFLGSNPEPSLAVLAGIRDLMDRYGLPVLISASRKSFLRTVTGKGVAESGPATLAAELYAASQGVAYVRTHDVAALRDGLTVLETLTAQSAQSSSARMR